MPAPDRRDIVVERIQFAADSHLLEGELTYDEGVDGPVAGVLLAGSHPLLGGNMHNNVVRGLGDGLAERGLATLRFNYRGVGHSQGDPVAVAGQLAEFWETSHVTGEMELGRDVQAAAEYLRQVIGPEKPLVLIGYSFGCALLPSVRLLVPPAALVAIAPPLGKHDYREFNTAKCPLLVIASENDFACTPERLHDWFAQLPRKKELIRAALDNHFFRGHEAWLVDKVFAFLQEYVLR